MIWAIQVRGTYIILSMDHRIPDDLQKRYLKEY